MKNASDHKSTFTFELSLTEKELIELYRQSTVSTRICVQQLLGVKHAEGRIVKGRIYRCIKGNAIREEV